ncbi:MAG TPA: hypothetical protein VMD27_03775 [Candidatus Aquilonibacter sp.]|nr:hypothetical protein [Candidatus Aquilonibacter sp.]
MLQDKIKAIDNEVLRLHQKWKLPKQVFGSDKKVAFLNEAAPVFFSYVFNSMLFDVVLSFSRLLDPRASCGDENLSFKNLLSEISDSSLRAELSKLISELENKTLAIETWRNKKLAHNDLSHALNNISMPPIQVNEVTEALAIIREIMKILRQRYNFPAMLYEISLLHDPGDGKSLMYHLKYGFEAFKEDTSTDERLEIYVRRDHEIIKWLND